MISWSAASAERTRQNAMTALDALHDVVRYFNDHAFARPTGQPALNVTPQKSDRSHVVL